MKMLPYFVILSILIAMISVGFTTVVEPFAQGVTNDILNTLNQAGGLLP